MPGCARWPCNLQGSWTPDPDNEQSLMMKPWSPHISFFRMLYASHDYTVAAAATDCGDAAGGRVWGGRVTYNITSWPWSDLGGEVLTDYLQLLTTDIVDNTTSYMCNTRWTEDSSVSTRYHACLKKTRSHVWFLMSTHFIYFFFQLCDFDMFFLLFSAICTHAIV